MNGEKLLRAMSYVDEDLVERAEKAARRKKHWVRVAALAACLCLALGGWTIMKTAFTTFFAAKNAAPMAQDVGGGDAAKTEAVREAPSADESGEEAAPQAKEPEMEPAGTLATEAAVATSGAGAGDWFIRMEGDSAINAAADLPLPTVVRSRQELEGFSIPPEVLERYGEDFFETRDLLLAAAEGGQEHPQVIRLEDTGEGWVLTVSGTVEGEDATQWRLLLPIEKDQISENAEITIKEEATK